MKKIPELRVVLSTAPPKTAERIAETLVKERHAACVNLIPGATSIYRWDGKMHRDGETLMILKTSRKRTARLLKRLKELHPYTVPEFLALEVRESNPDYAVWVKDSTKRKS